jgi:hypothetical protein
VRNLGDDVICYGTDSLTQFLGVLCRTVVQRLLHESKGLGPGGRWSQILNRRGTFRNIMKVKILGSVMIGHGGGSGLEHGNELERVHPVCAALEQLRI